MPDYPKHPEQQGCTNQAHALAKTVGAVECQASSSINGARKSRNQPGNIPAENDDFPEAELFSAISEE